MSSEQLWRAFYNCRDQDSVVAVLSQYSYTTVQCTKDSIINLTLLHWAAIKGWTRVCQLLIEQYQVDPDRRDTNGWTPLHWACVNNETDTVKYLVSNGYSDPLIKDNKGRTPLYRSSGKARHYLKDIIG